MELQTKFLVKDIGSIHLLINNQLMYAKLLHKKSRFENFPHLFYLK